MKVFKFFIILVLITVIPIFGIVTLAPAKRAFMAEMVLIPSGEFLMGASEGKGRADEYPRHKVYLEAFYFDKFEVTGGDFEEYLSSNPNQHPTITGWWDRQIKPDMKKRPVFGLSWKRCSDYCEWRGKRLATEAEWERVATGVEGRKYPWGNAQPDKVRANYNRCCFIMKGLATDKVGSYLAGATPEGIYDLAGNIAEWVYDWYDKNYYNNSEYTNPRGPKNGINHTIRGGAWNSLSGYLRSSARYGYDEAKDFYGIGCRCAKSKK
ncbi:MAG: formylglycine-generating enzyme family protein [Nitrospina sp.]|nr:formylglycine-generating enzyme family protein [Nitrospina sp.]